MRRHLFRKYVFTNNSKLLEISPLSKDENKPARAVFQIMAVRNIPSIGVKVGDLGGWIEKRSNLSQRGKCWVFPDAWVYDDAVVKDNACAGGKSRISGEAKLMGNAFVWNASVYERVAMQGFARAIGPLHIFGDTIIETDVSKSTHGLSTEP